MPHVGLHVQRLAPASRIPNIAARGLGCGVPTSSSDVQMQIPGDPASSLREAQGCANDVEIERQPKRTKFLLQDRPQHWLKISSFRQIHALGYVFSYSVKKKTSLACCHLGDLGTPCSLHSGQKSCVGPLPVCLLVGDLWATCCVLIHSPLLGCLKNLNFSKIHGPVERSFFRLP